MNMHKNARLTPQGRLLLVQHAAASAIAASISPQAMTGLAYLFNTFTSGIDLTALARSYNPVVNTGDSCNDYTAYVDSVQRCPIEVSAQPAAGGGRTPVDPSSALAGGEAPEFRELDAFAGDRGRTAAGHRACRPRPGEPSQPLDRRVDPQRRGRLDDELGATEVKLIARREPDRGDAEGAPARAVDRVLEPPRLAPTEREHAPRGRSVPIDAFRQPQLDVEPGACVRRGKRQLELDPPALDHAIGRDPDGRFRQLRRPRREPEEQRNQETGPDSDQLSSGVQRPSPASRDVPPKAPSCSSWTSR